VWSRQTVTPCLVLPYRVSFRSYKNGVVIIMQKRYSVIFRVFGAVVLVFALLVGNLSAGTIKIGTDPDTNTRYAYLGSEYIRISGSSKLYNTTEADLQLAIWDLNTSGGGNIYLPSCTISLTSEIRIPNNVIIRGDSGNSTILDWGGNAVTCLNISNSGNRGGGIYDVKINDGGVGIYVGNVPEFCISNVWVNNMDTYCIHTAGSSYHTYIENCRITWFGVAGIHLDGNGADVVNCNFNGESNAVGINVSTAGGSHIEGNWFELGAGYGNSNTYHMVVCGACCIENNEFGSIADGNTKIKVISSADNVRISNNRFEGKNNTCIHFDGAGDFHTVDSNTFSNFYEYAINIENCVGAKNYVISNNIFASETARTPSGFIISDSVSNDVSVVGNRFYMDSAYDIYAVQQVNIFEGNSVENCNGAYKCQAVTGNWLNGGDKSTSTRGVDSTYNIVEGNVIYNYAVGIETEEPNNIINDNVIGADIGSTGINIKDYGTQVVGNRIDCTCNNIILSADANYCLITNNNLSGAISNSGSDNYIASNLGALSSTNRDETLELIRNSNGKAWSASGSNIQVAVNDCDSGGWVEIPGNVTLEISTKITPKNNVTLRGADRKTSIIRVADNANITGMVEWSRTSTTYLENFTLAHLTLDGNCMNNPKYITMWKWKNNHIVNLSRAKGFVMHDCLLTNATASCVWWQDVNESQIYDCEMSFAGRVFEGEYEHLGSICRSLYSWSCSNITIDNVVCHDNYGGGIAPESYNVGEKYYSQNWVINGCEFYNMHNGVYVEGAKDIIVSNCFAHNNHKEEAYKTEEPSGFCVSSNCNNITFNGCRAKDIGNTSSNGGSGFVSFANTEDIYFVDCHTSGILGRGFYVQSENSTVDGCSSTNDGDDGFYFAGCGFICSDSRVRNNGQTDASGVGILAGANKGNTGSVISGCVVSHSSDYGIQVSCPFVNVVSNSVFSSTDHNIYVSVYSDTAYVTVSNNICKDGGSDGIHLVSSGNSTVNGNICTGNAGDGIDDSGAKANYTIYIGNSLLGNTGSNMAVSGGGNVIANNLDSL